MRIVLAVSAALATATMGVSAACNNPLVRREWEQLSSAEKTGYVNAVVELTKRPISGNLQDPNTISYYDFVATHAANAFWAHGNAQFYPYRAMMFQWERALNSVGWKGGAVYWDWPASPNQQWWKSSVWDYFGAVDSNDPDNCVLDGAFAKGKYAVSTDSNSRNLRRLSGDQTCLRRCGLVGAAVTDATTITNPLRTAKSYMAFHGGDTSNYHAVGHVTIGGSACDFGNPSYSPNDPVFFLHHGLVDKVWWRWQQSCPAYVLDYEGTLARADDPISDGKSNVAYATLNIDSWKWWTVADMLDTQGDTLCYTYSQSAGDLTIPTPSGCDVSTKTTKTSATTSTSDSAAQSSSPSTTKSSSTTASPGPVSKNNQTEVFSDGWMNLLLQSLVEVPTFKFNVPTTGQAKRDDSFNYTSGYITEVQPDSSTLVTIFPSLREVYVPGGYEISVVYESRVQAMNLLTKRPEMFFRLVEPIPYVKLDCAPENVVPGSHPCYLAKPNRVSMEYARKMKMNLVQVSNNDNIVAMQIDKHNCECDQKAR
ncbi:hypothetical protein CcCBS67573_g06104 [Chytriomyces confervae]|uniref:Tyrosinase copper-binding domain-containing protein n=1 Tax=Chytriomyces confervae TaxID=246404 RepID=A0A507F697_9FUNG|nr:hypothetical protein CcCBS67573_g06104 [Chytriomyces confervae]